jgi:HAD superfamily hydrolase (TIGR01509 family)
MPSCKLVIFDLDGTLVDAYRAVWLSVNHALKTQGLKPVDFLTVKRSVGWGERVLAGFFVPADAIDETLRLYRAHHKKALIKNVKPLPHAKRVLTGLRKKNIKIGIASNRRTQFTKQILHILKMDRLIDFIVCADQVKKPKPAADMLLKNLRLAQCKRDEALYVGDMTIDIATGKNAKIKTVALPTGSSSRKDIVAAKPFKVISSLDKLPAIIEKWH